MSSILFDFAGKIVKYGAQEMESRMKTIWFIFFGLLLLAAPASAQIQIAYTNADGSVYTYSTNAGGSCTVDSYTGPPWDVTIPTNINGLTVTGIGNSAFYQCGSLTNVTIPNTVTSIGGWAFYWHIPHHHHDPQQCHRHRGRCVP